MNQFTGLEIIALPICEIPIDLPLPVISYSSPVNTYRSVRLPNSSVKWCVTLESIYQELSQLLEGIVADVEVVNIAVIRFGSWGLGWEFGNYGW